MDRAFAALSSFDFYVGWLPAWEVSLVVDAVAVLLAVWVHSVVFKWIERWVARQDLFRRSLVSRVKGPTRLAVAMAALAIASSFVPLSDEKFIRKLMIVGIVILIGWIATTALHVWTVVYLRRFKLDSEDNLLARKHVTQSRILERVAPVS
jgi:hypothetical protein